MVQSGSRFESSEADFKRVKLMSSHQKVEAGNVFEQPSPLGLTLRKTPSFLDLIEMRLSQGNNLSRSHGDSETRRAIKEDSSQTISEKLKASNFPVNLVRIGTWERMSIHEGDLVAKCYYAKRKLVWEVLELGLKSKIEIQWSDISAIRAIFRENEADVLEIELCRTPLFFRETDPQPRKHTLWQTTSDFTGGQAPIYRLHYVEFPGGTFERHYDKLLQCDNRLLMLSKKPFPTGNSPYFYSSLYEYSDLSLGFNGLQPSLQYSDVSIPCSNAMLLHQRWNNEITRLSLATSDSTFPMSVGDHYRRQSRTAPLWVQEMINGQNLGSTEEEQVGALPLTVSTRQGTQFSYGDELVNNNPPPDNLLLNEIADHLLNDAFASGCSDEKRILAKVKSMCNVLDMSRESLQPGNLNKLDIDMKSKAYEDILMGTYEAPEFGP